MSRLHWAKQLQIRWSAYLIHRRGRPMTDDPKKDDSAGILGDMAEAHEEQPGENPKPVPTSKLKGEEGKPNKS